MRGLSQNSLVLAGMLGLALAGPVAATDLRFTNVTAEAGITHVFTRPFPTNDVEDYWMAGGAVAEDFNGDGWIDLYVLEADGSTNLLYMNRGDGTFANDAAARGADIRAQCIGAAAADYDNDGDIDIAVTTLTNTLYDDGFTQSLTNGTFILVNNGSGVFTRVDLVITNFISNKQFQSPSFGDLDNDGQLELAVGQWDSRFGGLFLFKGANLAQVQLFNPANTNLVVFSPSFADLNNDRRSDLAVVADFTNSHLYINTGLTGTNLLQKADASSGQIATDQNGMGCAIGDYDNDGDLDWFVSSIMDTNNGTFNGTWGHTGSRLYKNNGHGVFTDATDEAGVRDGNWGWGSYFGDLDNDGTLDLFHVNGWADGHFDYPDRFNNQPARLFQNRGDGTFTNVAAEAGAADTGQGRGLILFDYDNDGDLDAFIVNNQTMTVVGTNVTRTAGVPVLLRNDSPATNYWLNVKLAGTPPFHRNGIGSRAYIRIGTNTQMRELNASTGFLAHGPNRIAHFGLGQATNVDEVRAEWVDGNAVVMDNVGTNRTVTLPSPRAVLSTNSVRPGEVLTAYATNFLTAATKREWVVDGVTNADPMSISFYSGTNRELRLNVYDTNDTTILYSEFRRVAVRTINLGVFDKIATNQWILIWNFDSGRVFKVQYNTNFPSGAWLDNGTLQTSTPGAAVSFPTSSAPSTLFRVMELAP